MGGAYDLLSVIYISNAVFALIDMQTVQVILHSTRRIIFYSCNNI